MKKLIYEIWKKAANNIDYVPYIEIYDDGSFACVYESLTQSERQRLDANVNDLVKNISRETQTIIEDTIESNRSEIDNPSPITNELYPEACNTLRIAIAFIQRTSKSETHEMEIEDGYVKYYGEGEPWYDSDPERNLIF